MAPVMKKGKALHLQPNFVLLLAIFTFYGEAFVGVRPSVVLFRHFFCLRFNTPGQQFVCVSFIDVAGADTHLKAEKKAWALIDTWGVLAKLGAGFQDALDLLEVDFWDVEAHLAAERTRLAAGWYQLDASAKEAQGKTEAIRAEVQGEAAKVKDARVTALPEKEALAKCCEETEARLKVLQERIVRTQELLLREEGVRAHAAKLSDYECELTKVAAEQATEHGRLEVLQREVAEAQGTHAKRVSEANTKLVTREEEIRGVVNVKAAASRVALSSLELMARQAVRSICRLDLEYPLIPQGASYAKLSFELVKELDGAAKKVDDILEEECPTFFSCRRPASSDISSFMIPTSSSTR
ncbi:hypothetical protein D1007_01323 [Hordeum vulgare]|nr:hypothetical protein D1007_01323 [Hordeum vulgare]